jgi:DNA-binding transcriptional ArsR family regulator
MDAVFKALADPFRRRLLDSLREHDGQSLGELCAGSDMARQSVTKHLAVLEAAGLVATTRQGRHKLHHLNAAPIDDIADRWISRYHRGRAAALADLRRALEAPMDTSDDSDRFVYVTFIETTPEKLWQALTDPAFTRLYWGDAYVSDWRAGSPMLSQPDPEAEPVDLGQVVLESDPPRTLAYTWHLFQPEHAEHFGWSDERFAELVREPRTRVRFEIEPLGDRVKLTVTHEGERGSTMVRAIGGELPESNGWPEVLADLKTFLETGRVRAGATA